MLFYSLYIKRVYIETVLSHNLISHENTLLSSDENNPILSPNIAMCKLKIMEILQNLAGIQMYLWIIRNNMSAMKM